MMVLAPSQRWLAKLAVFGSGIGESELCARHVAGLAVGDGIFCVEGQR